MPLIQALRADGGADHRLGQSLSFENLDARAASDLQRRNHHCGLIQERSNVRHSSRDGDFRTRQSTQPPWRFGAGDNDAYVRNEALDRREDPLEEPGDGLLIWVVTHQAGEENSTRDAESVGWGELDCIDSVGNCRHSIDTKVSLKQLSVANRSG